MQRSELFSSLSGTHTFFLDSNVTATYSNCMFNPVNVLISTIFTGLTNWQMDKSDCLKPLCAYTRRVKIDYGWLYISWIYWTLYSVELKGKTLPSIATLHVLNYQTLTIKREKVVPCSMAPTRAPSPDISSLKRPFTSPCCAWEWAKFIIHYSLEVLDSSSTAKPVWATTWRRHSCKQPSTKHALNAALMSTMHSTKN